MKTFAQLFVGGVLGVLVLKLLAALILPLFGVVFGLVGLAIRLALFAALAYFLYSLFVKRRKRDERD